MKKVCICVILISYILYGCSYINNKSEYGKGMKWGAKVNYYSSEVSQDNQIYTIQKLNKDDSFNTLATFVPNKYVMCIDIMGSTKTVYKNDYEVSFGSGVDKNKIKKFIIRVYDIETNKK